MQKNIPNWLIIVLAVAATLIMAVWAIAPVVWSIVAIGLSILAAREKIHFAVGQLWSVSLR